MTRQIKIKLFSYDISLLDKSVKQIVEVARNSGCKIKGPIPLPTRKEIFTICRSVHVDKPSREQFERRTHIRLIVLDNFNFQVIPTINQIVLPAGVDLKVVNV